MINLTLTGTDTKGNDFSTTKEYKLPKSMGDGFVNKYENRIEKMLTKNDHDGNYEYNVTFEYDGETAYTVEDLQTILRYHFR